MNNDIADCAALLSQLFESISIDKLADNYAVKRDVSLDEAYQFLNQCQNAIAVLNAACT